MITVLELLKKSGEVLEEFNSRWIKQHPFVVLGYYDFLSVRTAEKYEDIYGQGISIKPDGKLSACFSKYSLITFDIKNAGGSADAFDKYKICEEMIEGSPTSPFYMVISCILREGFYSDKYYSGHDALANAKALIYAKMEEINADLTKKSEPTLRYQLLGNLGVFDVTLITASENLKALHWISSALRGIGNDKGPLVSYSSSFLTYNIEYLEEFSSKIADATSTIYEEPLFGLSARMTLHDLRNENLLSSQLIKDFSKICDTDNPRIRKINGEYDLTIFISDLTILKLIKLLLHKYLNVRSRDYNRLIRSLYALASCEFVHFPFSLGDEKHWVDKLYFNNAREVAWKEVTAKKEYLEDVWDDLETPVEIRNTLESCVNAAISLSRNNLEYVFGNYLIDLLTYILESAGKSQREINALDDPIMRDKLLEVWYNKFSTLIMNISAMLPNIHPANKLLLDSVEHQDAVNSIIKVMIANREVVNDFIRYSSNQNSLKNPFEYIFMTVGSGFNYSSNRFFWPEIGDSHDRGSSTELLSLNLPSERYMFFEQNMPIFLHELAHYVSLGEKDRTLRNKAFHDILVNYCVMVIAINMVGIPHASVDEGEKTKRRLHDSSINIENVRNEFKELIKLAWENETDELISWDDLKTMRCEEFCDEWRDMLQAILELAKNIEISNEYASIERDYPYRKIIEGIELLAGNFDFIDVFRRAALEARCDLVLLSWCRMGLGIDYHKKSWYNRYIDVVRNYFANQMRTPAYEDKSFKYRLAIIIGYFFLRSRKKRLIGKQALLGKKVSVGDFERWWKDDFLKHLTVENSTFIKRSIVEEKNNILMLLPFSFYLIEAELTLNANMSAQVDEERKNGARDEDITALYIAKSACGILTHEEELDLYMRSWYTNALRYKN